MPLKTLPHKLMPALLLMLNSGFASQSPTSDFQGYWKETGQASYERFLRVQGDSGFYCILDGKSSFAFKVIGDSITTPFNGMDKIEKIMGGDHLKISGEEKGEEYANTFARILASGYPKACKDEEGELPGTTSILMRSKNGQLLFGRDKKGRNILGKKTDAARGTGSR